MIGTMSHELARSWIIIDMLGKASALGSLQLAIAVPSVLLILHAGVIVDRANVRKIMMCTKTVLAMVAFAMAVLTGFGQVHFWQLLVFGVIEGMASAFDSPAFQALTVRLVPRADFQQALALNSTNFHAARMLGPLVAGLLMAVIGPTSVFIFDGLTYLVLIFVLSRIDLRQAMLKPRVEKPIEALIEGLRYIFSTPTIRYRILQLFAGISLVFPLLVVVMRTYIKHKFNLDAASFGYVFTIPALGSVMGALAFTAFKPQRPLRALFFGIPGAIVAILLQPAVHILAVSTVLMGLSGFFMYLSFAALTVSLQLEVEEEFRGRLGSVIGLGFMGLGPLMGFPAGVLADTLGTEFTIVLFTTTYALLSAILFWLHKRSLSDVFAPSHLPPIELKTS